MASNNFNSKQQIASFRTSLFVEGFLNDQFVELEKLEDDRDNPAFVESMVNLFLSQTPDEITCIEQAALEETPLDLVELNRCIYKFKGSIVSIGAKRVDAEIVKMLACLREDAIDIGGFRAALSRVKEEFSMLKYKLEAYIGLLRPKDLPSESADSNSPKNEGTSTSGDKEEVGSKRSAD